jgi:NAD(P)-dependent dehydrogenase (short-subunit alcohol dehydrogenase family)
MSKIVLITGANRGIGFAAARAFGRSGATVVVCGRDLARAEDAAERLSHEGIDAEPLQLDVDSVASVRAAAVEVDRRHGRVDVLVNNAGILPEATDGSAHEFVDLDVFAATYRTNVFGPVAVIDAFLPLVRKSEKGRIVNVSSRVGSLVDQTDAGSPYYAMVLPAYQSSKAALNAVTVALSKQLADTPIKVTSVCPGFVQTDLTPISREQAPLTADQAAAVVVAAGTLPPDAPTGTFVDASGPVPW